MNNRNKEILFSILKDSDQSISTNVLASRLNVSSRTIRNYIKEINNLYGSTIIVSDSNGYSLTNQALNYHDLLDANTEESILYYRRRNLLRDFIIKDKINLRHVMEQFSVSDSTIISDINFYIRKKIKPFNLQIRKDGNVFYLEGTEENKRALLSSLIKNETKDFSYYFFDEISQNYHYDELKDNIVKILSNFSLHINSYTLSNISTHLVISISRLVNQQYLEKATLHTDKQNIEFQAAMDIASYIEITYSVDIPQLEIEYISLLLSRNTYREINNQVGADELGSYIEEEYIAISKEIINQVTKYYLIDFDEDFFVRFTFHIKALAQRSSSGHLSYNPHTSITRSTYPFIFEVGVFISNVLKKHNIVINDDEIAYLAFHIGSFIEEKNSEERIKVLVDVPVYLNNLERIRNKLEKRLSFKAIFTFKDMSKENEFDYDLLITTQTIDKDVPVFYISPLITSFELDALEDLINNILRKKNNKLSASLYENQGINILFKKNYNISSDYKNMLKILCDELKSLDYTDSDFYESVLKREELSSTVMVDFIALPHSLQMDAKKNCLSVVINDYPINWNGKDVYVILLFAFSMEDRMLFKEYIESVIRKLYDNKNEYQNLLKISSAEEFIDWIKK